MTEMSFVPSHHSSDVVLTSLQLKHNWALIIVSYGVDRIARCVRDIKVTRGTSKYRY